MYQLNRKSDNPITVMRLKHWVWQDHWLQKTARKCKRVVAHPHTHISKDASPGVRKELKWIVMEGQRPTFYYLLIVVILGCIIYLKVYQRSVVAEGILFHFSYVLLLKDLTTQSVYIKWNYYFLCQRKTDLLQLSSTVFTLWLKIYPSLSNIYWLPIWFVPLDKGASRSAVEMNHRKIWSVDSEEGWEFC